MVWRSANSRPNPLHALRRVVEQPDAVPPPVDRVQVSVKPDAAVGVRDRPPQPPPRAKAVPRPASEPEPSHRRPGQSAQAVITSTPRDTSDAPLQLTPRPATFGVDELPPEWWLARRAANLRAAGQPDLRRIGFGFVPLPDRSMRFREVLTAMLVCLGLWAVIDSPALARSAAQGPIGTRRSVALDVLHPVARVTAALGLDRVTHVADDLLGHHHPTARVSAPPVAVTVPPAPRVTVPPPPITLRVPTAADPLRVLVVGDSLGLSFGRSLATKLDATGLVKASVDGREGTGLARPDAFDWIAQLRADIVRDHPEVVVVSFGGNDDQDVQVSGRFIPFNSPTWQAIYASRVAQVISTVRGANAELLWSGLPVVRSAAKTDRLMAVMSITKAAMTGTNGALFIDNRVTLADSAGHYATALPDASGNSVLVREPDGIHETPAGADRLADKAIAAMKATWKLATP